MDWKEKALEELLDVANWAKALAASIISGAATAVGAVAISPVAFDVAQIKAVAISGAVIGAVAYLKSSPLWK